MPLGYVGKKETNNPNTKQTKANKSKQKQTKANTKQTMTTNGVQPAQEGETVPLEALFALVKSLQEEIESLKEARQEIITPPSPPPFALPVADEGTPPPPPPLALPAAAGGSPVCVPDRSVLRGAGGGCLQQAGSERRGVEGDTRRRGSQFWLRGR